MINYTERYDNTIANMAKITLYVMSCFLVILNVRFHFLDFSLLFFNHVYTYYTAVKIVKYCKIPTPIFWQTWTTKNFSNNVAIAMLVIQNFIINCNTFKRSLKIQCMRSYKRTLMIILYTPAYNMLMYSYIYTFTTSTI